MTIRNIESKHNSRVKELRTALARPTGSAEPVGLEGIHLVQEALRSGIKLDTVFIANDKLRLLGDLNIPGEVEILSLPQVILDTAVSTESPQALAALAHRPVWRPASLLEPRALILVLDGIQDPGNLGTLLRSAEAFGASGVVSLPGTVNAWNPKAMRASAGSIFRLPVLELRPTECFEMLRSATVRTLAAMAHDARPVNSIDLSSSTAFVIGSEGSGLTSEVASLCDERITIPCPGPVESLNAAVAASVILYEASRQRAASAGGK